MDKDAAGGWVGRERASAAEGWVRMRMQLEVFVCRERERERFLV